MGNYKFRLSDMMPNAWFYKLREMGSGRGRSSNNQTAFDSKKKRQPPPPPSSSATTTPPLKQTQPPPPKSRSRKSYYFTRELDSNDGFRINSPSKSKLYPDSCYFPDPTPAQRKSSKQHKAGRRRTSSRSTTKVVSSSSVGCSCRTTAESIWTKADSPPEFFTSPSDSSPEAEFRTDKILAAESLDRDIIIDVATKYSDNVVGAFDSLSELELPPIITKHAKLNDNKKKETKQRTTTTSPTRRFPANSPGVRLRIHSPKIAHRKMNGRKSVSSRRSLSDSLAIMKSSYDPQRDFRESMVEMIVENNIRSSKDLEDLLACYLCLNADEYHDLIIKVFKQIWFDLTQTTV